MLEELVGRDRDGRETRGTRREGKGTRTRTRKRNRRRRRGVADLHSLAIPLLGGEDTGLRGSLPGKRNLIAQMVKAAGQRQHWREAIVLFDEMQAEGVPRTKMKAAYQAALRACAKGAEWERSTQLLEEYVREGYEWEEGVVSSAVKACCRGGRPDRAGAILTRSLSEGVVPEVSLFTGVMNACYTVGDMDAIISLGDQMRAQNITLDPGAYDLMITSHISNLDWVRATEELVDMGRAGISPSARSARQWRLASAAIEETEIDVEDDDFDLASGEGGWVDE